MFQQTHPRALFPDVGLQDGVRKVLMEHLSERILDTWQNVGQFVSVQEDIPGYIQVHFPTLKKIPTIFFLNSYY